jgi:uncharacterized protein YkwD
MTSTNKIEKFILIYINKSRSKRKLSKLKSNFGLKRVARNHSGKMSKKGKIWHGNGVKIAKDNISYHGLLGFIASLFASSYSGENVAMTSQRGSSKTIANSFHKMWMKSPGHRRNILDPNFKLIGIGIKKGRRGYFATELFNG